MRNYLKLDYLLDTEAQIASVVVRVFGEGKVKITVDGESHETVATKEGTKEDFFLLGQNFTSVLIDYFELHIGS